MLPPAKYEHVVCILVRRPWSLILADQSKAGFMIIERIGSNRRHSELGERFINRFKHRMLVEKIFDFDVGLGWIVPAEEVRP
jgi:hypothetical protein